MKHFFFLFFLLCIKLSAQQSPVFLSGFSKGGFYTDDGGFGTLSLFDANGNDLHTLPLSHQTAGLEANYPELVEAPNGKVYGLHSAGGNENVGILFEYDPATHAYEVIYEFTTDGFVGHSPYGGMILLPSGLLLGTTSTGASQNKGAIFSFDPSTHHVQALAQFSSSSAFEPKGQLLLASNGWVYGTTSGSGVNNLGAVYRFHPTTYQFQIVHEFSAVIDGTTPTGGLCEVTNGQLVGFCAEGGQYNNGLVYSLSLSNHSFSSLYSLNSTTTGKPEIGNGPVKLTDGTLIAVLSSGGDNDQGCLIFWDLLNAAPNKLYDFDSNSGSNPQGRICIHSNHSWYWQLNDFNGTTRLMEYNPLSPSLTVAVDSIAGGGLHGRPLELSSGELLLLSGTGN
ncbi:MAG: hypothetical protein RLZZ543_1387, partial [Bacteroidota bacterium]